MSHNILRLIFTAFLVFTYESSESNFFIKMMLEKERSIDLFLTSPIRVHHGHKFGFVSGKLNTGIKSETTK